MSIRPSLREQRLKNIEKTNSKLNFSLNLRSEDSKIRPKHSSIPSEIMKNIPNLHIKVLSLAKDELATSRRRLGGLHSTKTAKRINLSMASPSNNALNSSRIKVSESFSLTQRKTVNYPCTPEKALEKMREWLNEYEKQEILQFKEVYFPGIGAPKVLPENDLPNLGFDNDKGEYKVIIGDHLEYRYEIIAMIGKGSFGQVCKCLDHKAKEMVAVKIIKNKRKYLKQGMIEVKLLKHMKEKDPADNFNIVKIINYFTFRNHLCIVFELLSSSLYDLIKQSNFRGLSMSIVSRFAIQTLVALEFSHSLNIIHCDLKPENILLKTANKAGIKVIDFGSGCYKNEKIYTYIQSRFYRAPEIMLGIPYSQAIDIWSFGCILVELYIGYPIFPGEDEQEQFLRIAEVLGIPPSALLEESMRKKTFFDGANRMKIVPNSRGKMRYPGSRTFEDFVGTDQPLFVEFIKEIFQWTPELRPSAAEALNHPWIQNSIKNEPLFSKKRKVLKSFIDLNELNDMR